MKKILVLTQNLLAEQELQISLQRYNTEVYCSSELFYNLENYSHALHYFSAVEWQHFF